MNGFEILGRLVFYLFRLLQYASIILILSLCVVAVTKPTALVILNKPATTIAILLTFAYFTEKLVKDVT